jgi:hypothetical protein
MSEKLSKEEKKKAMKDIILELHQGISVEVAKERFEKEVGNISSTEIAEIEQSLIDEGLSPEEIKKFCNVHALLFQSTLEKSVSEDTSPAHPVYLFKLENREIEKLIDSLKGKIERRQEYDLARIREMIKEILNQLRGIKIHYQRKEQLLFPFLEKRGLYGPSKVMWGKDNEIRELLAKALLAIEKVSKGEELEVSIERILNPLIEEVSGMIFKEEKILFPTCLEKLSANDWVEILKESDEVGYVFIEKPKQTETLMQELKDALLEEPIFQDNAVSFPTGALKLKELMWVLNTLPVDITFVDKEDRVRYFSDNREKIFARTKSIIGRKVQNCHPPQSVDVVERILKSFKKGKRDSADFWINLKGKLVYIRYFAVRDRERNYLGTLEVTQDITEIKKLQGEKRLHDERD